MSEEDAASVWRDAEFPGARLRAFPSGGARALCPTSGLATCLVTGATRRLRRVVARVL
jgi:hypothetical protein